MTVTARKLRLTGMDVARALAPSAFCSALLALALLALLPRAESMRPAAGLTMLVAVGLVVYVSATAVFARGVITPMWGSLRSKQEH